MRKDVAQQSKGGQIPVVRRSNLFAPWFDDMGASRWFDDFLGRDLTALANDPRFLAPAMDIEQTANEYVVSTDLPGIKKEDIAIECAGDQVTISAERKYESAEGKKQDRCERFYGMYQRSFSLPMGVDSNKIEASYDGGVLTLRIPKGEEAKSRRIEIGEKKADQNRSSESKH